MSSISGSHCALLNIQGSRDIFCRHLQIRASKQSSLGAVEDSMLTLIQNFNLDVQHIFECANRTVCNTNLFKNKQRMSCLFYLPMV